MGVNFDYNLHGVIIENLIIDGPAYTAGLSIGDLIVEINEKKISDTHQLQRIVSKSKPSEDVTVRLYRRGKGYMKAKIKLQETPKNQLLPRNKKIYFRVFYYTETLMTCHCRRISLEAIFPFTNKGAGLYFLEDIYINFRGFQNELRFSSSKHPQRFSHRWRQ